MGWGEELGTFVSLSPWGFHAAPDHNAQAGLLRFSVMRFVSHFNNSEIRMHLKSHKTFESLL